MTKTENYHLNQWESSDRVLMEDFNEDNAKLDAAIASIAAAAGNCRIVTGSYIGTGVYGKDSPNTLTFDGTPLIVFIACDNRCTLLCQGQTGGTVLAGSTDTAYISLFWQGNQLSWYNSIAAVNQINIANSTCYYFALLASDL